MSIGLNQFGVGTIASATEVAGLSGIPGNDKKLKNMLAAVKLRNRAQPMSLTVVTSIMPQGVMSASGSGFGPSFVVHQLQKDSFIKTVQVSVIECKATSIIPEVTVDAYLISGTVPWLATSLNTFSPSADAQVVEIMREHKIKASPAFSLKGGGFPKGIFTLPVKNQFIPATKLLVLRFSPPPYNGSTQEGWRFATVTMHFSEFHQ